MARLLDNLPPKGDFLSSMSKKGTSGRKRSTLGMGPFREHPLTAPKAPVKEAPAKASEPPKAPQNRATAASKTQPQKNAVQKRYKSGTNPVNAVQTTDPAGSKCGTNSGTFAVPPQTISHPADAATLRTIRGNYRRVLMCLYTRCRTRGERTTSALCLIDLAQETQISYESVRTTLRRMLTKGLIKRTRFATGRSGWVEYEIPEFIYKSLLEMESSNVGWPEMRYISGSNSGSLSGQIAPCSSSEYLKTTTTTEDELIKQQKLRELSSLDLSKWGIRKHALLEYMGEGKVCENKQDLEEFLHRANAAIKDMRSRGEKIRSTAGFLMHCLKEGYVGVPDGYKSLEEIRLEEINRDKRQKLEGIKKAKREKYRVEFELFKETVDNEQRSKLFKDIEGTVEIKRNVVGDSAYERALNAKLEESMMDIFVQQYEPIELRGEVSKYLVS